MTLLGLSWVITAGYLLYSSWSLQKPLQAGDHMWFILLSSPACPPPPTCCAHAESHSRLTPIVGHTTTFLLGWGRSHGLPHMLKSDLSPAACPFQAHWVSVCSKSMNRYEPSHRAWEAAFQFSPCCLIGVKSLPSLNLSSTANGGDTFQPIAW